MLEKLNRKQTVIIIGRANSGTRILPEVMKKAGVYIGEPLNVANDLLPVDDIYAACRGFGMHAVYNGNYEWDFSKICQMDIPSRFIDLLTNYLQPLIESEEHIVGWKIPNNNMIYPWLTRLLPNATYIHWMRHPEANCVKMTGVDRLEKWNVPCKKFLIHEWNYKVRAQSWKYHFDIVENTPKPDNFTRVRFEDYVLNQEIAKQQVEELIGIPLQTVELNKQKASLGNSKFRRKYPFLGSALNIMNYA